MKNFKHLFKALLLMCATMAFAEEVTINGMRYDVITKAKQAKVISGGNYSGDIIIPATIVYNGVTCNVTVIENAAFYGCSSLTSITIPHSITSIGSSAFYDCLNLSAIHISDISAWCNIDYGIYDPTPLQYAKKLYLNGNLVTNLIIPNGVTTIKPYAFCGCTSITSITIPNSVTSIGEHAFYKCDNLNKVYITDIAAWCNIDFANYTANPLYNAQDLFFNGTLLTDLIIPNSVKDIGCCAFYNCTSLKKITIPNSVTSIGKNTFYNCSEATNITIGNSVTCIGESAFQNCSEATNITIGNRVTSIEKSAFSNCSKLKEIVIPNSTTSIGKHAFVNCSEATNITIGNSVTSIGEYAFQNCSAAINITIGNSVTSIEKSAFYNCSSLTNITLPNKITSIESRVFEKCSSLTSIIIPNSVKKINSSAFSECKKLASVTIGENVNNIGMYAFASCENLTDVYSYATTIPVCEVETITNDNIFHNSYPEYMTLHVPATAINDYKTTTPWSSFGNITTLNGTPIIITPKCAKPVISYSNGELSINCATANAEFITDVTCSDIKKFYDSEIRFSATYNISVYATATGYDNSDTVNATLCWIECNCNSGNGGTNVISVPTTAVLVTSSNGVLSISCQLDGEEVAVYTTAGTLIDATTIENGNATLQTGLAKGTVLIVNIAGKSVKVILN